MKRKHYSQHFVPMLTPGPSLLVPTAMRAALIALAGTSQDACGFELGGPAWSYECNGVEKVARVQLTLSLRNGGTAYWDALERDSAEEPGWVRVKREHARLLGHEYWLLTQQFIEANLIEYKNRISAYYLLVNASGYDSCAVEQELLLEVDGGPVRVYELSARLGHTVGKVKVAALRLWKRRLLSLPVATELLSDGWRVSRGSHASH